MSTTITLELCKEDRDRLDKILEALKDSRPNCENCCRTAMSMVEHARIAAAKSVWAPAEPVEAETQKTTPQELETPAQPAPAPERPAVTHAEIMQQVVRLSTAGKKAEVKEIVTAYADKVSAIPEDKLQEVADKLAALS